MRDPGAAFLDALEGEWVGEAVVELPGAPQTAHGAVVDGVLSTVSTSVGRAASSHRSFRLSTVPRRVRDAD